MRKRVIADSSSDSEEDNPNYVTEPNAKEEPKEEKAGPKKKEAPAKKAQATKSKTTTKKRIISDSSSDSDDDDNDKKFVASGSDDDDNKESILPPKKSKTVTKKAAPTKKASKKHDDVSDDDGFIVDDGESSGSDSYTETETEDDVKKSKASKKPAKKSTKSEPTKRANTKAKAKNKGKNSNSSKEEIGATKGTRRWKTLIHNGPMFPPPYVPHGVPLVYDKEAIVLPPEIEEVASFYARYVGTDHAKKAVFNRNFFKDFRNYMKETKHNDLYAKIKKFELCNFARIHDHLTAEAERRKIKTKAERALEKAEKEELRKRYGVAIVDGTEQRVGNFIIEPPGLFLGRGTHPKTGMLKRRVTPEMVTINVSKGHTPKCPVPGHAWGDVICDDHVTWLATWHENINGRNKYVWLHATSTIKGASDQHKYDVARQLKDKIAGIRRSYTKDLADENMLKRQRATALWLIDKLALRVGGEKGEDEADTVGCCSLRVEHVTFPKDRTNVVSFDFLGKDSMRYQKDVEVPKSIYDNLKMFASGKKGKSDELFDKLSTTNLNEYLKSFMAGLTAKVFRTYNASFTLQEELRKAPPNFDKLSVNDKVYFYNCANKQVAILCNHQKTIKQNVFSAAIGGLKELIIELVKQRNLVTSQIRKLGGKVPKQKTTKSPLPPKKKMKKVKKEEEEGDENNSEEEEEEDNKDFENSNSDNDEEGKSKKRKTGNKKSKKIVDDNNDDDFEEEEEEEEEEMEVDENDEELKALIQIDENDIKEDDPDIIEYKKSKEEKMKIKAQREKLIQEKETQMAMLEVKKEENDEDESDSNVKVKVKKEPNDDDYNEDSESNKKDEKPKSKSKAKTKVKKEKSSDDDSDDDNNNKKKKKKKQKVKKISSKEENYGEEEDFVMPTTVSACETRLRRINERIEKTKAKMVEKGELRNVALGTSKLNYMDPRITVAWSKKVGVPLERVFPKTLREKFNWALDVDADFVW